MLRSRGQLAFQPPGKRMEPKETAVQMREEADERIMPADVRNFMSEDCSPLRDRPGAPCRGDNERRREDTGSDWGCNQFGHMDLTVYAFPQVGNQAHRPPAGKQTQHEQDNTNAVDCREGIWPDRRT